MALIKSHCGACGAEYSGPFHACYGKVLAPPSPSPSDVKTTYVTSEGGLGGLYVSYSVCPSCGMAYNTSTWHSCPGVPYNTAQPTSDRLLAEIQNSKEYLYNALWSRCDGLENQIKLLTITLSELLTAIKEIK